MPDNPFRRLPAVARLLELPPLVAARSSHPPDAVTAAARAEIEFLRAKLAAGEPVDGLADPDAIAARVLARLDADARPQFRPVINATGVVLHTNLGRSPLHESAAA